jgi:hypothetical protein
VRDYVATVKIKDDDQIQGINELFYDEHGRAVDGSIKSSPSDFKPTEGLKGLRVPVQQPILQFIPIDISLRRNEYEDPITEDLRATLGLVLFLAQKTSDLFSRIGNIVPSVGWKIGFQASFLTGTLNYTDEWKEHTDYRVWHHRKGEVDLNLATIKGFFFGGFSVDVLLVQFEFGGELYIKMKRK